MVYQSSSIWCLFLVLNEASKVSMQDAFMTSQASGKPELYSVEAAGSVKLSEQ